MSSTDLPNDVLRYTLTTHLTLEEVKSWCEADREFCDRLGEMYSLDSPLVSLRIIVDHDIISSIEEVDMIADVESSNITLIDEPEECPVPEEDHPGHDAYDDHPFLDMSSCSSSEEYEDELEDRPRASKKIYDIPVLKGAVRGGSLEVVKYVVENYDDDIDHTLESAARYNYSDILRYLLDAADSWFGRTIGDVLLELIANGNLELTQYLMEYGYKPRSPNQDPDTMRFEAASRDEAMELAICSGNLDLVKYLIDTHYMPTSQDVKVAARTGYLDIFRCFVDELGLYSLEIAAARGNLSKVKKLVEDDWYDPSTGAIREAAIGGHIEIVNYLKKKRGEYGMLTPYEKCNGERLGFIDVRGRGRGRGRRVSRGRGR